MAKCIDGKRVETIGDETVNRTFEFLNQYPKVACYEVEDNGRLHRVEEYVTEDLDTLEESIKQALTFVNDIVDKSDKIWLRIFPQLRERDGKYRIRIRLAHRDKNPKKEFAVSCQECGNPTRNNINMEYSIHGDHIKIECPKCGNKQIINV